MNYLDIFDNAKVWIKYVHFLNKKYYRNDFLEVGAGIGSFTDNYEKNIKNIFLTEIDENNLNILKSKYKNNLNIKIIEKEVADIEEKFNTIAHFNVLEHIKEDKEEIYNCLNKINQNGYLVILVFEKLDLKGNLIVELKYIDCLGYLLYYLNKIFFKDETYPSNFKIFVWDKLFTPITMIIDFLTFYKLGKNILCVIKKK